MRGVLIGVICLSVVAVSLGCGPRVTVRQRKITGTCEGACDLYLTCKNQRTPGKMRVCIADCRENFSGTEGLKAFEHLSCEKAVSFIEGANGRGPGTKRTP